MQTFHLRILDALVMDQQPERHQPHIVAHFLECYARDREEGRERSLEEYTSLFPGHEALIAQEFADLHASDATVVGFHEGTPREPRPDAEGVARPWRLGHYEVVRELGRGGQGAVYLARDLKISRMVALKVLHQRTTFSPMATLRFQREVQITARLNHPGICPVYETGADEGALWIAMQFVEGTNLARHIANPSAATFAEPATGAEEETPDQKTTGLSKGGDRASRAGILEAVRFLEESARILHTAHEAGVVHRDIKPGNIMIGAGGRPVILDFGVAQDTSGDHAQLTVSGEIFGTLAYMSPEQLRGETLDRRTDVWSLGVTLYECLTGHLPFQAPSREALFNVITTREPANPRALCPNIPSDLAVVVAAALEKGLERRYQSAEDLAEDLRRVRQLEPVHARPAGPWLKLKRWAQRNPVLASATAALTALLAGGLILTSTLLARSEIQRLDLERLSDRHLLSTCLEEVEALLPPGPGAVARVEAWLERAGSLVGRTELHRARLGELRSTALFHGEKEAARDRASHPDVPRLTELEKRREYAVGDLADRGSGSSPLAAKRKTRLETRIARLSETIFEIKERISRSRTWDFEKPENRWQHDLLAELVEDLERLADPDPRVGHLARVRGWLDLTRRVQEKSLGEGAAAWKRAIASIRDPQECPLYEGLELTPQFGLLPLWRNPTSGLWEFAHLQSGKPPQRDSSTGKLEITAETGLVLVLVPGGTCRIGSQDSDPQAAHFDSAADSDETPVQSLTLAPFFLSSCEMSQAQWQRATLKNPSAYGPDYQPRNGRVHSLLHPVEQVSWNDCQSVLRTLGLILPTEARWEHACRAGTGTPWSCGAKKESLRGAANLADQAAARWGASWPSVKDWPDLDDGYGAHAPVASYRPNPFGLFDMHGNVSEWCRDWFGTYRSWVDGEDALRIVLSPRHRTYRGGSFLETARVARSSMRSSGVPGTRNAALGLRPARNIED